MDFICRLRMYIMESQILLKFVTHNYCIYGKYIISSNFSVLFDIFYRSRESKLTSSESLPFWSFIFWE